MTHSPRMYPLLSFLISCNWIKLWIAMRGFSSRSVPTNACALLILAPICSRFNEPRFPENGRFYHIDICLADGTSYTGHANLLVEPVEIFRVNSSSLAPGLFLGISSLASLVWEGEPLVFLMFFWRKKRSLWSAIVFWRNLTQLFPMQNGTKVYVCAQDLLGVAVCCPQYYLEMVTV